jgi:hypothetical protein
MKQSVVLYALGKSFLAEMASMVVSHRSKDLGIYGDDKLKRVARYVILKCRK